MEIDIKSTDCVVLPAATAKSQYLIKRSEIDDFSERLAEAVTRIGAAIEKSQALNTDADRLISSLGERSWWGGLKANLSGTTDKELAFMVARLGESVEVTQDIVSLILQIESAKSKALHGFNDALVKKIAAIQGDTTILDENQRYATLYFLGELKNQLDEQIRRQELVDRHAIQLAEVDRWKKEKEEGETLVFDNLSKLSDQAAAVSGRVATLGYENSLLKNHIASLEARLSKLETIEHASHSGKARFLRHLLPSLALVLVLGELFFLLR
jgi:hypothetical protein